MPSFFFFNDTATTEIYTLSLHDALPISSSQTTPSSASDVSASVRASKRSPSSSRHHRMTTSATSSVSSSTISLPETSDRKSTRLNSSHVNISYAVFCLKKKT